MSWNVKDCDLTVKDLSELTDEQTRCNRGLGPDGAKTLKIKFHDKLGAIALLMEAWQEQIACRTVRPRRRPNPS